MAKQETRHVGGALVLRLCLSFRVWCFLRGYRGFAVSFSFI